MEWITPALERASELRACAFHLENNTFSSNERVGIGSAIKYLRRRAYDLERHPHCRVEYHPSNSP